MNRIRPIRTEADYDATLTRIETLMDLDDQSEIIDELEVLTTLVEVYEDAHYVVDLPSPVEAIKFRMEQQGLTPSDLVSCIGSRSKVSEILSGKRTLTLSMIRALNTHLGIPAEVLIGEPEATLPEDFSDLDWSRFPLKQMVANTWFPSSADWKDRAEELMRDLIRRAGGAKAVPNVLYRKNNMARRNARMDPFALQAWCFYVLAQARTQPPIGQYVEGSITFEFLREVAHLSVFEEGPKLARELLSRNGIALVYAQHLKNTYLDGAAMRTDKGWPVIGMSIRYDRIDNFWFCLLHELVHVGHHLTEDATFFVDDLSIKKSDHEEDWALEDEADQMAQEALIPTELWERHNMKFGVTPTQVMSFAQKVGVHAAIVAGRVRKEQDNYRLLSQFVGNGEVRHHFEGAI